MGDGASDMRREERQAQEHYYKIDSFFALILSTITQTIGFGANKLLQKEIEEWDTYIYKNACSLASERHDKRVRQWMKHIKAAKFGNMSAWAMILTEAKMRASDTCFRKMHEASPFSGKPIVVIVPNGEYLDVDLLGDYRGMHDFLEAGNTPFAKIIRMPERAAQGIREGGKEIRERGWDDVRFISF